MRNAIALFSLLLACLCPVAHAGPGNEKVQVETVADTSAIVPGKPFMLGFKFTIAPGWHIYWKNPGDSGIATQVKLDLPEGFAAGDLMFPVPTKLQLPGDIVNYAYENQVMLTVKITPPKDLTVGNSITIAGKASWLVCQDTCVPGKADVSVELPVASNAKTANEDLFKLWNSQMPVTEFSDVLSLGSQMDNSSGDWQTTVDIGWQNVPTDIQFIPGPLRSGDLESTKVTTLEHSTKVTFRILSFKADEPITGLLVFKTAKGERIGMEISFPCKDGLGTTHFFGTGN